MRGQLQLQDYRKKYWEWVSFCLTTWWYEVVVERSETDLLPVAGNVRFCADLITLCRMFVAAVGRRAGMKLIRQLIGGTDVGHIPNIHPLAISLPLK